MYNGDTRSGGVMIIPVTGKENHLRDLREESHL